MKDQNRPLRVLAICGPTASGKSDIAVRVAERCGGEIVNADSRQVYRGMRIGTGWPEVEAMARVPHHGYGIVAPNERYSAGRFVADARTYIESIASRSHIPLLVGGTGLYVEALAGTMPLDRAVADEHVRARIARESRVHAQPVLHAWLRSLDREAGTRVMPGDAYRTLRALEALLSARDGGQVRKSAPDGWTADVTVAVLEVHPAVLRRRIETRVSHMFQAGLMEEAREVRAAYGDAVALNGLGFAEALAVRAGLATLREAISRTVSLTLKYAKRQQTWFRRMSKAVRIDADAIEPAVHKLLLMARECRVGE